MKRITHYCLFVLCTLVFPFTGFSQENARVTLNMKDVSLLEVFDEITKQTQYEFVYSKPLIDKAGKVSVNVKNETLEKTLETILEKTELGFKIEDKHIIISPKLKTPQTTEMTTYTGEIKDKNGTPLPGATIQVAGTTTGVAADTEGKFAISVPDAPNQELIFSFVGMKKQTVKLTGQKTLSITMEEEDDQLEEVVVTGIFNKPKESFTGAAVKFTQDELKTANNRSVLQALSNLDPSFVIVENNSAGSNPNVLPEVRLRGVSTIPTVDDLQNSTRAELCTPLFILDGFEITLEQMMDLNNDEIASITILKDASSTAMYGSRGANGVIVITSIEPQVGKLKVSYSGNLNLEIPDLGSYNLMNAREKLQVEWEAGVYNNDNPTDDAVLKQAYAKKMSRVLAGVNTNWLKIPVRVGTGQDHYLNLTGGDQHFRFSMGLSYNIIKGAMRGSDRNTLNGNLRLQYLTEKFSFSNNVSLSFNKSSNGTWGDFSTYANLNPYYEPYDEEGNIVRQFETEGNRAFPNPINNPLADAHTNSFDNSDYTNISNNFQLTYNPTKTIQATVNFSYSKRYSKTENYTSPNHSDYWAQDDYTVRGERSYSDNTNHSYSLSATCSYYNTWGKHIMTAGVNYSLLENQTDTRGMRVIGFLNESMNDLSNADSYKGDRPSSSNSKSRSIGLAASVNYNYDNRYFADVSYRADGSSSFGNNSRWAPFWSIGCGWNINQEKFIQHNVPFISLFRIKYSYGVSGSQQFSPWQSLGTYTIATSTNYHGGIIANITGLENPDLKWQSTYQHNVGADISLWESRLSITANYYRKLTKNSITDMALPLSTGFDSYTGNSGEILNTGFDVSLSFYALRNLKKGLSWSFRISTSHNKNKLLKLSDAIKERMQELSSRQATTLYYVYQEGESTDAIYAMRTAGVDPSTGKVIYVYKDGTQSYHYDVSQQVVCGDRMPKFDGRLNTNFVWKNFSIYASFTLRLGGQKYNNTYASKIENVNFYNNLDKRVLTDRWKAPGDHAAFYGYSESNNYITDRYVQDENTLQCTNINISYTFPKKILKQLGLQNLSLNASLANLFYISTVRQERGTSYPYAIEPTFGLSCSF